MFVAYVLDVEQNFEVAVVLKKRSQNVTLIPGPLVAKNPRLRILKGPINVVEVDYNARVEIGQHIE